MKPTALVTGASRGIGLASALALAEAGFRVFATSRAPEENGGALREAAARGAAIELIALDVCDPRSVDDAALEVHARGGGAPDVVVSNAGTGVVGALEEVSDDELRAVMETNLFGAARLARAFAGPMRVRGHGRMVFVGSIGGRVAAPGTGAYSASKFALVAYTDALRRELARFGVKVSSIEPGAVKTDLIGPSRWIADEARRATSPYRATTEMISGAMQKNFETIAMPAERVAEVVVRAATAKRPSPRYLVGVDARVLAAIAWIPSIRIQDAILEAMFARLMARGAESAVKRDQLGPAPPPSRRAT